MNFSQACKFDLTCTRLGCARPHPQRNALNASAPVASSAPVPVVPSAPVGPKFARLCRDGSSCPRYIADGFSGCGFTHPIASASASSAPDVSSASVAPSASASVAPSASASVFKSSAPEFVPESVPEFAQESVPEFAQEPVPEFAQESVPEFAQEPVPEFVQEPIPNFEEDFDIEELDREAEYDEFCSMLSVEAELVGDKISSLKPIKREVTTLVNFVQRKIIDVCVDKWRVSLIQYLIDFLNNIECPELFHKALNKTLEIELEHALLEQEQDLQ
jgi:hypothetical protein